MIRPIVMYPDPGLGEMCTPVLDVAEVADLIADMFETMYAAPGRGLAAPQVGVLKRVFVMDAGWKTGDKTPVVMINPEILSRSTELQVNEEGCLSIPDTPRRVARPARVEVMWLDETGMQRRGAFDGFEAACICHENDHLDGILILDHEAAA
ncbi:peptide deformylase [Litoreibacter ponti]|uniref:Peptide deformylase n=1 Tax=Litoreibacter ponti TaxID=1510457 RepID=A0A2T6BMQ0_9RHOB|nr:peptide deformylase [Litoreibacter ponti]PTX57322.1 peptide deformylase [Litoreibacter ponti]